MYIFVIAFLCLLFYGSKYSKDYIIEPLNYQNTIALRGICAIEIVIGHIGAANRNPWLFFNRKAGVLVVGIFFFLSGYGLMYSLKKKENYLLNFFKTRIPKILVPAIFIYIIYYILDMISAPSDSQIFVMLKYFSLWEFSEKLNWYVTELLFLYVAFYLLYKNLKIKTANSLIFILCLCFVIICYYGGAGNTWYGSTLCFPLGILFCFYEAEFLSLIKRKYILFLSVSFLILSIGTFLFFINEDSFISNVIGRSLASVSFCIGVITILLKVKVGNNITNWVGKMSYELFLVHELFVFQDKFNMNCVAYSVCAFTFSIFFGYILHKCNEKIFFKFIKQ